MRAPAFLPLPVSAALLLAACAGGASRSLAPLAGGDEPVPASAAVGEELVRQDALLAGRFFERRVRLFYIASRLRTANADLCTGDLLGRYTGLLAGPDSAAGAAGERYPGATGAPLRIVYVLPESPAHAAGMLPGDLVLSLDGVPVPGWGSRLEVAPGPPSVPVRLEFLRGGEGRSARIEGLPACRLAAVVAWGQGLTARSNLVRVAVTTALMRFVESDDELAVAVGHEMAHRLLGHDGTRPGRHDELAADRLGMYLAARAGYDPDVAPGFLRRLAAEWVNTPEAPRGMRERMAERAVAATAVAQEIARAREAGGPLVPPLPPR